MNDICGQALHTPHVHSRSFMEAMIELLIKPMNGNSMHILVSIYVNTPMLKPQTSPISMNKKSHPRDGSWNVSSMGVKSSYFFCTWEHG
jgi:hypothetical protein